MNMNHKKHRNPDEEAEQRHGSVPKTHRGKRRFADFFRVFLAWLLILLTAFTLLFTVFASAFAVYIQKHPETFTLPLSLFLPSSGERTTRLYYFPSEDSDQDPSAFSLSLSSPFPDLSKAVELTDARLYGVQNALYVPLSSIPDDLKNAFIAIEDKRFYSHNGIDFKRTGAAVLKYLLYHDSTFGGSTITQQLIKNVTGENAHTPERKIAEIFRALDLERNLSKEEILEQYLNLVNLANGCRGVAAAAETYFSKSVSELTLPECATIAAITQNPSRYDPIRHPENNLLRRNVILHEMFVQGYLDDETYKEASGSPLALSPSQKPAGEYHSWYTDLVIEDVIRDFVETYGYTRAEASHLLYTGGLRIYTLMNPGIQETLEAYYRDESHFKRLENGQTPQSGMIVLDPYTGNILGVAGAIGKKSGDRIQNYATDVKRPPGSVLKPLSVYAPALENRVADYASVFDDTPVTCTKRTSGTYRLWPKNASGVYRGLTSVDYALTHSLNTVSVKLLEKLGTQNSFHFLKDTLGIDSLILSGSDSGGNPVTDCAPAALALGQLSYGATLREITAAYTIFENRGIYRNARSYAVVTDESGQVLLENKAVARPAISEGNAELMTKMLSHVVQSGTAKSLKLQKQISVAGKTGTTQYSFDRWFIGYTPYLLAGVWCGCEYPSSLSALGGNPALGIFDDVMQELHASLLKGNQSGNSLAHFRDDLLTEVKVCADSGKLPSDVCRLDPRGNRTVSAWFVKGCEPDSFCTCHTAVDYVDSERKEESGVLIPGSGCAKTRTVGLLRVFRNFPASFYIADAQYTAPFDPGLVSPEANPPDPSAPYFASLLPNGTYAGKSMTKYPFNRAALPPKEEPPILQPPFPVPPVETGQEESDSPESAPSLPGNDSEEMPDSSSESPEGTEPPILPRHPWG